MTSMYLRTLLRSALCVTTLQVVKCTQKSILPMSWISYDKCKKKPHWDATCRTAISKSVVFPLTFTWVRAGNNSFVAWQHDYPFLLLFPPIFLVKWNSRPTAQTTAEHFSTPPRYYAYWNQLVLQNLNSLR